MPPLDEGAFLWMPTTMPHASIGEVLEVVSYQDQAIASVPEVASVTGKIGRAESALDPAPVSMLETLIHYHPEYISDEAGRRVNFRYDRQRGEFARDGDGELIPDPARPAVPAVARSHPEPGGHLGRDRQGGAAARHDQRAQAAAHRNAARDAADGDARLHGHQAARTRPRDSGSHGGGVRATRARSAVRGGRDGQCGPRHRQAVSRDRHRPPPSRATA
jgi:hypothetical protein